MEKKNTTTVEEARTNFLSSHGSLYKTFCFLISGEDLKSAKDSKDFLRNAKRKINSLGGVYAEAFNQEDLEIFCDFKFEETKKKEMLDVLYCAFDTVENDISRLRGYKDLECLVKEMISTSEKIAEQIENIEKEIKSIKNILDN